MPNPSFQESLTDEVAELGQVRQNIFLIALYSKAFELSELAEPAEPAGRTTNVLLF